MISFTTRLRVEFYDTDAMGVVWHGNYVQFLERARCDLLDFIGYNYYQMGKDGYTYPVTKLDLKYIKPAHFQDEIEVITTLVEFESFLKFKYLLKNAKTGEKLATATTSQATVKVGSSTLDFETPKVLQDAFKKAIK